MVKLLITYKDYIHCTVHGLLSADLSACVKEFKVFIPSARFQASYKLGRWDGYKQYFTVTGQTYVNLLPRIFEIIDLSKYEIEYVYKNNGVSYKELMGKILQSEVILNGALKQKNLKMKVVSSCQKRKGSA